MNLTIILRLYKVIQYTVPILLETLTLPGKYSIRFIMRNERYSVVLGRENVAITPTEVTDEGLASLNQHYRLDYHVDISSYTGATRHLKYL